MWSRPFRTLVVPVTFCWGSNIAITVSFVTTSLGCSSTACSHQAFAVAISMWLHGRQLLRSVGAPVASTSPSWSRGVSRCNWAFRVGDFSSAPGQAVPKLVWPVSIGSVGPSSGPIRGRWASGS